MSKAVLLSIKPKYCELIANGKKTIEVRKTRPKLDIPFKCYIYCTNDYSNFKTKSRQNEFWIGEPLNSISKGRHIGNGKVIGEFVCDYMTSLKADNMVQAYYNNTKDTCLTDEEIKRYANSKKLYYWHISDLKIYDKPKELGEFKKIHRECWYADLGLAKRDCPECKNKECFMQRPPQSWCYVESEASE